MEKSKRSTMLASEPLNKLILQLAVPSIIAQLISIIYNTVDKIYIGHLVEVGNLALAGVGVCVPLVIIMVAFSLFICGGAAPIAAIFLGRGKYEESEKILGTSTFLLIAISVIMTVGIYFFLEPLLYFFGASTDTFPYAYDYFSIYVLGTIFVQISIGLNTFISCQGQSVVAMLSISVGAVINIILDPILIFSFGLGVKGAAIATVISQAISSVFIIYFLTSTKTDIKIRLKNLKIDARYLKQILALGVSPFVMEVTESAITFVFNTQFLKYGGDIYIGVITIIQNVMMLLIFPISGFTLGVQPIISYNFGANNIPRVKSTVRKMLKVTLIVGAVYNTVITLFAGTVARIFTSDAQMISLIKPYLPVFMIGMWIFGIQMTTQSFLVGTNQPKTSLFIALLRKVFILIPLAFLLPPFLGATGIFISEPIADTISATASGIFLYKALKKIE